ncbi:MAG: DUF1366 domain-containing protein [Granulicatella sp.]|nr:MAG: DUF1366 domain-containing protein [Granulicatella sp.]RKW26520.1 MAG: DUF1366 domain-containing protein [Granulicatella sp.]
MANYKKNFARATYDTEGRVLTTIVSIFSTTSGTIIEVTLQGDFLTKNEDEIVHEALEQFYQDTYPNRAENEKFQKMEKVLKESTEALDTTRKTLAQSVVKEFEYETNFHDIDSKLAFLAKHLNVAYPEIEEDDEEDDKGKEEKAHETEKEPAQPENSQPVATTPLV